MQDDASRRCSLFRKAATISEYMFDPVKFNKHEVNMWSHRFGHTMDKLRIFENARWLTGKKRH
jgi:hypothetical protein